MNNKYYIQLCNKAGELMNSFGVIYYESGRLSLYNKEESEITEQIEKSDLLIMYVGVWNHLVWHTCVQIEEKEFEYLINNPTTKYHYMSNYEL